MVLIFLEEKGITKEQYREETGNLKFVTVFSFVTKGTAIYVESIISPEGVFEEVEASSFYNFDLRTIKV